MKKLHSNIYEIGGKKTGKRIVVLGGVHGSERTGIAVVGKMLDMVKSGELELISGSVVLALGNEEAIEMNQRWTESGMDLNRFFTRDRLEDVQDDSYEALRARQLAKMIKNSDVLLDIHSTNTPSRAFLACENESKHYEIHKWFHVDDVITDPGYILSGGECSTTDEYMNACGGVGVCIETGYAKDAGAIEGILESILNILADQEVIERELSEDDICANRNVYKMHTRIDLTDKGFNYEGAFGKGDFKNVEEGQIIGHHGVEAYKSPINGIVLLQFPRELWQLGGPVGYLAEKM